MAASMAAPPLTLLFPANSGEKSRAPAAVTFAGGRRRSSWRIPKSTGVLTGGAAAALPVAAAATPPGGDLSVLIPISALLLVVYWVSNFVVADMVARDLQHQDDDLSSQDQLEDPRF